MDKLFIKKERNTPEIIFDPGNKQFEVSGRCFPENSKKFFKPVLEWFDDFMTEADNSIMLTFSFYYISSSSIISVLELIKRLDLLNDKGHHITINWKYDEDDEDIRKIGEDYARITKVPFRLVVNPKAWS